MALAIFLTCSTRSSGASVPDSFELSHTHRIGEVRYFNTLASSLVAVSLTVVITF